MKKNFLVILIIATSIITNAQTKNFLDQPYLEVTGTADSLVTPNEIFIKIIISEKDTRDRVSLEESEAKMIAGLKSLDIATTTDLTVTDMLSNYKTYLLKQKDILKSREYLLKVTDAATTGKVFMKLEELGIANTSIEKVGRTDLENLENLCRTKAVENAKLKAIALTKPLSQTIGNAIHITNLENNFQSAMYDAASSIRIRGGVAKESAQYVDPGIEFEKIKITIAVTVRFILK
jgi:uncharacterized protein YggE